jgi:trehalose/maltose hydrolase-like predicted phosphorylase
MTRTRTRRRAGCGTTPTPTSWWRGCATWRASCRRCCPPAAAALRERLGIGDDELAVWQDMSRRMFVSFLGDGIISQFEGYDDLDELDWDAYRAKYGNIQRLDRIFRAEGKDPNRYKVTKQADTVMLFFLFRNEELHEIFVRLG